MFTVCSGGDVLEQVPSHAATGGQGSGPHQEQLCGYVLSTAVPSLETSHSIDRPELRTVRAGVLRAENNKSTD